MIQRDVCAWVGIVALGIALLGVVGQCLVALFAWVFGIEIGG